LGITGEVDAEAGVILERWTGVVTSADVEAYWTKLVSDPRVLACTASLANISECTLQLSGGDVQRLAMKILAPVFQGRKMKSAVVVDDPVQYGVARQYRAYASSFTESAIFTDIDAARAWIRSTAKPPEGP
jgi:hypothetical protein